MTAFNSLLARLASFTDAEMDRPWTWSGHGGRELQVRYVHWHCFQLEAATAVRAQPPASDAAAIMDLAQANWGDLRGLLAGLDDSLLDAPPAAAGDWTLRQLLAHVLLTERRYARQVEYAVTRPDAAPVYQEQVSALDPGEDAAGSAGWIERMEVERRTTDALCRGLDDSALSRPTAWAGHEVEVRWRLERFAAHLAEHSIHFERLVTALGRRPGDGRQAARRISCLRGLHERRTPPSDLAALDSEQAALVATAE